jgi:hypothetical protein
MAESALRYIDQMYMMGIGQGPAPARPQRTKGQKYADMLGAASLPLSGVPIAGDIAGVAADAAMYAAYPEERTWGNYAMSALGGLPLIPGAAALRAAKSDPIDMPSISAGSKINLNPNKLTFREADQNRVEQAAELFDSGEEINPIVTIYNNGRRDILDGHNRAAVAISRRQNLPAVDIDIKEYERLKEAGFDDMEITYATLLRANEDDAASAINNQFYGAGIRQRGTEALSLMDDPAAVVPAPSPLEGTLDMSSGALKNAPSPATKSIEEIFNLDQNATNADLPKSRDTLVWMSPDDFLAMAAPTKADYNMSFAAGNEKTDAILAGINQGDLIDVPHLKIFDKDGVAQVEGHEGRHRASLMKELGYDTMPVVINSHRIRWANQAQAGGDQIGGKWPSVLRSEIDPWGTVDRKSRDIPFPVKDPRGSQTELKTPEGAPSPLEGTLDMSTEARMQKAAEGGYLPETYYHATSSDFEEFVPKYADQLTFITPNVNFANNWLGKGGSRSKLGSARYDDPLNLEYKAESKKIWDKYSSEYGVDINSWPEIEQQNYRAERNKVMNLFDSVDQSIYPLRTNVQNTFDPRQHEDVIVEYLQSQGRDPLATTIQGGITDLDYYKMGNYLLYENPEMVQLLKKKGFDSMRLAESTYDRSVAPVFDTLAVFNPSNIRSVNAAFDPAKRGSANLMAGAAGATIGLSALRNIQRDEEPQPD